MEPLTQTSDHASRIEARLSELRRLIRSSVLLRGAALGLMAIVGVAILSFIVDRMFRLSLFGRAAAFLVYAGALAWIVWRLVVRPLRFVLTEDVLADLLERKFPQFYDTVRSAVDFRRNAGVLRELPGQGEMDAEPDIQITMKREVIREASEKMSELDVGELVDSSRVVETVIWGCAVFVLGIVLSAVSSSTFNTWFRRNLLFGDVEWPCRTLLVVEGFAGDVPTRGVPRGDPLIIRVRALREVPIRVRIRISYERETQRFNLAREGDAVFVHDHPEVSEPFEFVVEGGDFRSPVHRVLVKERPEVEKLRVILDHPAYTRKARQTVEGDIGELTIPQGTRLNVEGLATKPLEKASLETEGKTVELRISPDEPRHFSGGYLPEAGGTVTVHLQDTEGVPPNQWMRFAVTSVPDRMPTVAARAEGIGSMITPNARIPFKVKATDDYAVTALGVDHEILAEKEQPVKGSSPFPAIEERQVVEEEPALEIEPLKIVPERRLDVHIFAIDNDGLHGPKKGYAATQSFLVVTPEKLLEEFLRREEEQRLILERAIVDERNIRDTSYRLVDESWKIEGPLKEDAVQQMISMAKMERQISRQMTGISGAMRLILDEMRNNRIAEAEETERLAGAIIGPLGELSERLLPAAATRIGLIREMVRAEDRLREGLELSADLESLISLMERVLASMKRVEGFTEVVNRLRGIIKIHGESSDEARKAYRREIQKIFDDLPPPGKTPGTKE